MKLSLVSWKMSALLGLAVALATTSYSQTTTVGDCDLSVYGDTSASAFTTFDRELRQAAAEGDASKMALLVEYPLRVNGPGGAYYIRDASSLYGHFKQIFTPNILKAVQKQRLSDIDCESDGIDYGDGDLWVDRRETGYAIQVVNIATTINDRAVPGQVEFACRTEKDRVVLDVGQDGKLRYRSWEKPHSLTEAPTTVLSDGARSVEGTGGCTHEEWTFTKDGTEFSISALGCFPDSNQPPPGAVGQLSITSKGKNEWWWCF